MLVAEVVGVHPILPYAGQVLAGAHVGVDLFLVVVEQGRGVGVVVHQAAVAVLSLSGQAGAVQIPHQRLFAVLHVGVEQVGVGAPVAQAVGHVDPHLLAGGGGFGMDDGGAAVALADHHALLLEQGHAGAQLGGPAGGRHACGACTHHHDVIVAGFVGGDVAQLHDGGLHFLGGQTVGNNGLGGVGAGGLGGNALGLVDAVFSGLLDGVGSDGGTAVAVHFAGLGAEDLLDHLVANVCTIARGLARNIDLDVGDLLGVKGHGDLDRRRADAGGLGGVGARGIGARSRCGSGTAASLAGRQRTSSDTAHGGSGGHLQKAFAGNALTHGVVSFQ